jgi:hypothetical protein
MRAGFLTIGFVALALVAMPFGESVVSAQQKPTTNTYQDSFFDTDSDTICGQDVELQFEGTATIHETVFGDGRHVFHVLTDATITFELSGVLYTASFTSSEKEIVTNGASNLSFTFRARAIGEDGSVIRAHGTFHLVVNADGEVTSEVEFESESCPD